MPTKFCLAKAMVSPVVMYRCESWPIKKAEHPRIDAFEPWCWRRFPRVPWTARRSNQSILKEISPGISLEGMMLKLKLQYFGHLMQRADSLEKTWCWERLKAGGEGDDKGRDGWMASLTQWTWVWASSGSWWWTGKPGILRSTGSQRVGYDWVTELKDTAPKEEKKPHRAERAKRSMKKESRILETQGKDKECYSVWRINSPKRWGIISPLLSVLFLFGKLGMKGWGRTFDSPSCQSLCWQLLFFAPANSLLPSSSLHCRWMSWVVPPPQRGCSLLTPELLLLGAFAAVLVEETQVLPEEKPG